MLHADAEASPRAWLDILQGIGDTPEHRDLVLQTLLDSENPNLYDEDAVAFLAHIYDDHRLWGQVEQAMRQWRWSAEERRRLRLAAKAYRPRPTQTEDPVDSQIERFRLINAETLRHKELPPEQWIIEEKLPAGCTVLAGRSKDGKSMMAYGLAVAVATGGAAFGTEPVTQGDVLYLALEDGEQRAKKRLNAQCEHLPEKVDLSRLELILWESPALGEGLEEALNAWIASKPEPRLIIIDILEKVRPRGTKNGNVYAEAYGATAPLTQLAQERNIAILVVHHVSKIRANDIRDMISGPVSLLGGADTFWVLKRASGDAEATLSIGGRDVAEQELAMRFENGYWTLLDDTASCRLSATRRAIVQYLSTCSEPQSPKAVSSALPELKYETLKKTLKRMAEDGHLLNFNGLYDISPSCQTFATENDGCPKTVPDVPGVPVSLGDSPTVPDVPAKPCQLPLKPKAIPPFRDTGTLGTPESTHTKQSLACPGCGEVLVRDACGYFCLTCRCRIEPIWLPPGVA